MGLTLVSSERSTEELDELFRTIVNDNDFLNLCEEEINKTNFSPRRDQHGDVVHEINMSVYYNVQVDRNNADLTFVERSINVNPEKKKTTRRRATICSLPDDKHEFDPASLERIVEQQLEAARRAGSWKNFQPIDNNASRTHTLPRTKFVAPPILDPPLTEKKSKLTTPLKSIRRQIHNRNPTAALNRKVSNGRESRERPLPLLLLLLDVVP